MSLHWYGYEITRVHDGDTMGGRLDLGFYMGLDTSLRLHGINSPELTVTVAGHRSLNPDGEEATLHLLDLLGRERFAPKRLPATFGIPGDYLVLPGQGIRCVVHTRLVAGDGDTEKYGRALGQLYLGSSDEPLGLDVNAAMLATGYAVPMA